MYETGIVVERGRERKRERSQLDFRPRNCSRLPLPDDKQTLFYVEKNTHAFRALLFAYKRAIKLFLKLILVSENQVNVCS